MSDMRFESFKDAIWSMRRRGLEIERLVVHPSSASQLVAYLIEWGADPFPCSHFSILHPFRKLDKRLFFCGVPVEFSMACPAGCIGSSNHGDILQGLLNAQEEEDAKPAEGDEVLTELKSDRSLTGLMIKAMENMDAVKDVIVFRFMDHGGSGRVETLTTFNPLELSAVMQKTVMSILQNGQ